MPATSLSVIIGGICAAVTLIVAMLRAIFKAVAEAQTNSKNLDALNAQTQEQDKQLAAHDVRLAVVEDRLSRDEAGDDGSK